MPLTLYAVVEQDGEHVTLDLGMGIQYGIDSISRPCRLPSEGEDSRLEGGTSWKPLRRSCRRKTMEIEDVAFFMCNIRWLNHGHLAFAYRITTSRLGSCGVGVERSGFVRGIKYPSRVRVAEFAFSPRGRSMKLVSCVYGDVPMLHRELPACGMYMQSVEMMVICPPLYLPDRSKVLAPVSEDENRS